MPPTQIRSRKRRSGTTNSTYSKADPPFSFFLSSLLTFFSAAKPAIRNSPAQIPVVQRDLLRLWTWRAPPQEDKPGVLAREASSLVKGSQEAAGLLCHHLNSLYHCKSRYLLHLSFLFYPNIYRLLIPESLRPASIFLFSVFFRTGPEAQSRGLVSKCRWEDGSVSASPASV